MDFLKICLTLGLFQLTYGATCREGGHCERPHRDVNFNLETFRENTAKASWYMIMGDAVVRSHIASVLTGTVATMKDDFSTLCGRSKANTVTQLHSNGMWMGMGDKKGDWSCNRTTPGILECSIFSAGNKYEETNTVYVSKTDNKSFMVVIMCYHNLHSGWFVISSTPTIEDSRKKMLLDHIESLGFDRDNVVCLTNEKCPK